MNRSLLFFARAFYILCRFDMLPKVTMIIRGLFALPRWPTRWTLPNTFAFGSRDSVFRMKSFIWSCIWLRPPIQLPVMRESSDSVLWSTIPDEKADLWNYVVVFACFITISLSFCLEFFVSTCSSVWCSSGFFSTLFTFYLNSITVIFIIFVFCVSSSVAVSI